MKNFSCGSSKICFKNSKFLFVSIEIFTTELIETKNVTLFLGHPVGADFIGMLLQKLFGKLDFLFKCFLCHIADLMGAFNGIWKHKNTSICHFQTIKCLWHAVHNI